MGGIYEEVCQCGERLRAEVEEVKASHTLDGGAGEG
jgi:hypothetical protein